MGKDNEISRFFESINFSPHDFFSKFDELFGSFSLFPGFKADVKEIKEAFIIEAEMPGINKENVDINIDNNIITITVRINENSEIKEDDGRFVKKERKSGQYSRSFTLDNIRSERIKAEMKDGLLTLYCPKRDENYKNIKKIEID